MPPTHRPDKLAVLRQHSLFRELSPTHLDRLASCTVTKPVRRGGTIFAKGDPGSTLFAICKGSVKISMPSADGHDAIVNVLKEGDIFGEIALLDGRGRSADATAFTDCELFAIERRDFLPILREQPDIAVHLIEILCARLRRTTDQAESLMFLSLPARLAKALLRLAEAGGYKVSMTQNDLASSIGMTRESTNRQLRDWERKKYIRLDRGEITILSPGVLAAIAESDGDEL
jgi:CRP/FNR family transcriptional regulator, cyclic AMP receptor protein